MASRPKRRKLARRSKTTTPPDWSKLKTRFKAVMKDVKKEVGKGWKYGTRKVGRGVEKRVLPSLKRARQKLEGLITHIEKRI